MKNKKLLWLLIGLVSVCVLFAACGSKADPTEPSETVTEAPTQTEPSATDIPVDSQPEETEPADPEETTEPEETEPEETEPSGGTTQPNLNTGTGGGYNPGGSGDTTQPEDPAEPTQPVIEVPAPGSENNAYYEYVKDASGKFSTVKIPAGGATHYRIQTAGTFLQIEGQDMSVEYNGTVYAPEEGVIKIDLPADESAPMAFRFVNNGTDAQAFSVKVEDAVGSESNPVEVESLAEVEVSLTENDLDGTYYSWTADKSGMLKLTLAGEIPAEVNVSVNGSAVQLTEEADGKLSTSVKKNDKLLIQVQAMADAQGNTPAGKVTLKGYIAETVTLKLTAIPMDAESVSIPAGQSVYYRISGGKNKMLLISGADAAVWYKEQLVEADENGQLMLILDAATVTFELVNNGTEAAAFGMHFDYPIGHQKNPEILTELGELETVTVADEDGYYYRYTVPGTGIAMFQMWTYPEGEGLQTDISVKNETTGEYVTLWKNGAESESVSLAVEEGHVLLIHVTVKNVAGKNMDAQFTIYGAVYGSQEQPIVIYYPGFTAKVPVGKTLYYEGYNMSDLLMKVVGTDLKLVHNGVTYLPVDGQIQLTVTAEGREAAVFAITNTGTEAGTYEASFTYPIGHSENPDTLKLGSNTMTQKAGGNEYSYKFVAPRAGKVTISMDAAAQWLYTVDNLTQGIYGDTQWSDSDPQVAQTTINVKAKDEIRVRVNTYNSANEFETPAGTVTFQATYVSGPVEITNFAMPYYAELMADEYAEFTGMFYGYVLRVTGNKDSTLEFNGTVYKADSTGVIKVDMPKTGTEPLTILLHNGASQNASFSVLFSTTTTGSAENPEKITVGSYSMVQSVNGGGDYYYQFIADKNGKLIITFETDVDAIIILNNTQYYYTHMGKNKITLNVRPGAKVNFAVNTYDLANPMVSPVGTVDFTVEMQ